MEVRGNAAAATYSWTTGGGERVSWSHALILRDGRIARMQDFSSPSKALRAIGR